MNESTEDAPVSDEDKQDGIDSESWYPQRTTAIRGDALAHMACAADMKYVFDNPEPQVHR